MLDGNTSAWLAASVAVVVVCTLVVVVLVTEVWFAAPVAVVVVCTLVVVVLVADVLVIVVLVCVVHVCVVLFTRGRVGGGGGVAFVARRGGGVAFVARSVAGATSSEHAYSEDWNLSHAFMYLPAPSLHDTQPNPAN